MNTLKLTSLIVLLLGSVSAYAGPILLTDNANQTTAGQNFQFDFAAPTSDGTAGNFTFRARGDYSFGASLGESVDIDIDGIVSFDDLQADSGNAITRFNGNDVLWEVAFAVSAADLLAMTADNTISIFVDLANGVNLSLANAFVDVRLDYNENMAAVPESGTLALLGLGLLGCVLRRKSNA